MPSLFEKSWFWRALWTALAVSALSLTVISFVPAWRLELQGRLRPDNRELLASVSGDLLGNGIPLKILKFSTLRGIIVEVHGETMLDRIFIPDPHDGYFSVNTHATRLALVDVDGDGRQEIIAPSFDDKLVAHLNTLRLDPDSLKLELVKPPAGQ